MGTGTELIAPELLGATEAATGLGALGAAATPFAAPMISAPIAAGTGALGAAGGEALGLGAAGGLGLETALSGTAGAAGSPLMPPAILDPAVSGFTATGTNLPSGAAVMAPAGGGGSVLPATVPSTPAGGATGTTGGTTGAPGGTSFVDTLIKQMKDNALGLGLIGGSLAMQPKQKPLPNEGLLSGLGQQGAQTAQQLLGAYQSGKLSPGQQASLDQLAQNTKNQINQYFANIGQLDSTAHTQALAQVDQQALGLQQQMLNNMLQQGLSAIGIASGPLNQIAQFQLGQDQALRESFGGFAQAVGNLFGRGAAAGSPQTAAPTTTPPAGTVPPA